MILISSESHKGSVLNYRVVKTVPETSPIREKSKKKVYRPLFFISHFFNHRHFSNRGPHWCNLTVVAGSISFVCRQDVCLNWSMLNVMFTPQNPCKCFCMFFLFFARLELGEKQFILPDWLRFIYQRITYTFSVTDTLGMLNSGVNSSSFLLYFFYESCS